MPPRPNQGSVAPTVEWLNRARSLLAPAVRYTTYCAAAQTSGPLMPFYMRFAYMRGRSAALAYYLCSPTRPMLLPLTMRMLRHTALGARLLPLAPHPHHAHAVMLTAPEDELDIVAHRGRPVRALRRPRAVGSDARPDLRGCRVQCRNDFDADTPDRVG